MPMTLEELYDWFEIRPEDDEAELHQLAVAAAIKERDELIYELNATRAAAKRGMDAATSVSSSNLRLARKAMAESNPAALSEQLTLNERLTNELESVGSELATLKQCLTDLAGKMERQAEGNLNDRGNALSRYTAEILVCMKTKP